MFLICRDGHSYLYLWQVNVVVEVIYDIVDLSANLISGVVILPSLSG